MYVYHTPVRLLIYVAIHLCGSSIMHNILQIQVSTSKIRME